VEPVKELVSRAAWGVACQGDPEEVVRAVADGATVTAAKQAVFGGSWEASWITLWHSGDPAAGAHRDADGRLVVGTGANAYALASVWGDAGLTSLYAMLLRRHEDRDEGNVSALTALIERGRAALLAAAKSAPAACNCARHRRVEPGLGYWEAPEARGTGYDLNTHARPGDLRVTPVCASCLVEAIAPDDRVAVMVALEYRRPLGMGAEPRAIDALIMRLRRAP